MSDLESTAVSILDKLDSLATQYAPDVVDAAVSSVQVSAVSHLVGGLVAMAGGILALWIATNFANYAKAKKDKGGYMSDWEIGVAISFVAGGLGGAILFLVCISQLFEVWNYVEIFNPKLALAHQMLGL